MIEKFPEGPGTFRANPFNEHDSIYDASTRHLISQELLEMTSLRREEKIQETELNNKIFNLTLKMNRNEATEEEHQDLAVSISMQRTKQELLELGNSIPKHKVLDYVIHQLGSPPRSTNLKERSLGTTSWKN